MGGETVVDAPERPDYRRLRKEVDAGHYPFLPEDEGALLARCEWLEKQLSDVLFATSGIWHACQQRAAEDWRITVGIDKPTAPPPA